MKKSLFAAPLVLAVLVAPAMAGNYALECLEVIDIKGKSVGPLPFFYEFLPDGRVGRFNGSDSSKKFFFNVMMTNETYILTYAGANIMTIDRQSGLLAGIDVKGHCHPTTLRAPNL